MSADEHLSRSQFANVQDLVYKYAKRDNPYGTEPREGHHQESGPHTRGADFRDLVRDRMESSPEHLSQLIRDVSRRGVITPIGVDHSTTPPTVSEGHTRLIAAYHSGQKRVPVVERSMGAGVDASERLQHAPGDVLPDVRLPGQVRIR